MKKGAIIGIVCGVLAVGIGAIGVSAAVVFSNPTVKVVQGVKKLFSESGSQVNAGNNSALVTNENYKAVLDFDIYDVEELDDLSLGIDATVLCDYENKKMKEDIGLSLSYYEFLSMQMAADNTDVYLDIPALYDGSICFDSQNINEQYNNSIFKEMFDGVEMEEELSMNFFDKAVSDTTGFYDENKEEIIQLVKNADIEKTDKVLPVEIGEKTVNCQGYSLSLKKEDVNTLLESIYEESGVTEENIHLVDDSVEIVIYMDKKNNIKKLETEEDIKLDGKASSISAVMLYTGEENPFDEITGEFDVTVDGENIGCDLNYAAVTEGNEEKCKMQIIVSTDDTDVFGIGIKSLMNSEDGSFDMEMDFNMEDESIMVDMKGSTEQDSKSYVMSFTDCAVYYNDEKVGSFEGSYRVQPLEEEIVISPTKTYPIFEFTEEELSTFVLSCYEKLQEYTETLDGLEDLF